MWWLWILLAVVVVLGAYIRLAPTDVEAWHQPVAGSEERVGDGDFLAIRQTDDPRDALRRVDDVARAVPRTHAIAGSVAEGRVTYLSRSLWWGFPDFTTVEARDGAIAAHARLRFGRADFGANKRRLEGWLAEAGLG
ncbi:MAG: DUF1499 domain-containing protein [Shimia sp.]